MRRSLNLVLLLVLWALQLSLLFLVFGGPDAIARKRVDAAQPTEARAASVCTFHDAAGRASLLRLRDFTTGTPVDLTRVGQQVCALVTAASRYASAVGEPLVIPAGMQVEILNEVAGGALVETSIFRGPLRIALSRPLAEVNPQTFTFTLGHEIGHVALAHGTRKNLLGFLTVTVSLISAFLLLGVTLCMQNPALARRLGSGWLVLLSSAAASLCVLSQVSMTCEYQADAFATHAMVETGLTLTEAAGTAATVVGAWRDESDVWWRGAGAHPPPAMRAARLRALQQGTGDGLHHGFAE